VGCKGLSTARRALLRRLFQERLAKREGIWVGPPLAGGIDYVRPRHAGHGSARSARDRASSGGRNVEPVGRRWHSRSRRERSRTALIRSRRKVEGAAMGRARAAGLFRRHSEEGATRGTDGGHGAPRHLAVQQTGRPVFVSLTGPPQVSAEWLPYGYKNFIQESEPRRFLLTP
jgi:hypothetical protein